MGNFDIASQTNRFFGTLSSFTRFSGLSCRNVDAPNMLPIMAAGPPDTDPALLRPDLTVLDRRTFGWSSCITSADL